jgi:hypothetical protein
MIVIMAKASIRKIPLPPLDKLTKLAIFLAGEGRVRENQCA